VELHRSPTGLPLFFNEVGVSSIEIGVTAFNCMGALAPHDHPHVYLNMGEQNQILCPYCSTEFRLNPLVRKGADFILLPGCIEQ
jgi:uncharacterized Zn-finger protein